MTLEENLKMQLEKNTSIKKGFANNEKADGSPEIVWGKITEIIPCFEEFKKKIDKYPNAFSIMWDESEGYLLNINFDLLEHLLGR